jgi:hypothetical protein
MRHPLPEGDLRQRRVISLGPVEGGERVPVFPETNERDANADVTPRE